MLVIADNYDDARFLVKDGVEVRRFSDVGKSSFVDNNNLYISDTGPTFSIVNLSKLLTLGKPIRIDNIYVRSALRVSSLRDMYESMGVDELLKSFWNYSRDILVEFISELAPFSQVVSQYKTQIGKYLVTLRKYDQLSLKLALAAIAKKFGSPKYLIGYVIEDDKGYYLVENDDIIPVIDCKIENVARKTNYSNGKSWDDLWLNTDSRGPILVSGKNSKGISSRHPSLNMSSYNDLMKLLRIKNFKEMPLISAGIHIGSDNEEELCFPGKDNGIFVPKIDGLEIIQEKIKREVVSSLLNGSVYLGLAEVVLDIMFKKRVCVFYSPAGKTMPVFNRAMEIFGYPSLPTVTPVALKADMGLVISNFFPKFVYQANLTEELVSYIHQASAGVNAVPYPIIVIIRKLPANKELDVDIVEIPESNVPMFSYASVAWNLYLEIDRRLPIKDSRVIRELLEDWRDKKLEGEFNGSENKIIQIG